MPKVPSIPEEQRVPVKSLVFDKRNPRMPDTELKSDEDVIKVLIEDFDVEEIVESILGLSTSH